MPSSTNSYSRRELRYICDKSLYHFIKIIGGSVQQGGDISPIIHKPLTLLTQDDSITRKFKLMPRIWRKSTCFTKWANIWRYLQNNEVRILIPAENIDIGSRFLDFIERQLLANKMLRWIYPELEQVDKSWTKSYRWSGSQCELPREGIYSEATFTVIGVGGAAQSGHYDFITPDDLIGKKAMESPVVMEGVLRWIDNAEELLVDPQKSVIDGVGTHWAVGDYIYYIQQNYPEFVIYKVPALKDSNLKDNNNKDECTIKWIQHPEVGESESNFPEVFSTQHYIDMINNPEKRIIFFSQQQNNPEQSEEFNKFDADWLKTYQWQRRDEGIFIKCEDGEEFNLATIPKYGIIEYGGMSSTKTLKKGCRNCILIAGQPRNSIKKFIFYCDLRKLKSTQQFKELIYNAHGEFSPIMWYIETFGQQSYILDDLQKDEDKPPGFRITSCEKDVGAEAKHRRIQNFWPAAENNEVYIHPSMKHWRGEYIVYPTGLTMDGLDAFGWLYQLKMSRKPKSDIEKLNRSRGRYRFATSGTNY